MSSKYSRVKGPQGLPKTCKRQPPYCDDVSWPPPTLQSLITFHGYSTIGSRLDIVEVIRPQLDSPSTTQWLQTIERPCYKILFDFETHGLKNPLHCMFIIVEAGVSTAIAWYPMAPYVGTDRYDTLQQPMSIPVGSGQATFRVML